MRLLRSSQDGATSRLLLICVCTTSCAVNRQRWWSSLRTTWPPTHLAFEDIAILRSLPNMTILAPCDANEMRHLIHSHDIVMTRYTSGWQKVEIRSYLRAVAIPDRKAVLLREPKELSFYFHWGNDSKNV